MSTENTMTALECNAHELVTHARRILRQNPNFTPADAIGLAYDRMELKIPIDEASDLYCAICGADSSFYDGLVARVTAT